MDLAFTFVKRHRIADGDPLSAKTQLEQTVRMQRESWSVRVECRAQLAAEADAMHFTAELRALARSSYLANLACAASRIISKTCG